MIRRGMIHCLGPLVLDRVLRVDRLPAHDEKAFIVEKFETAGGPPRNAALSLAHWGEQPVLHSVIGDDVAGRMVMTSLGDSNLSLEAIDVQADLSTATTVVIVDATGEKAILIDAVPEPVLRDIGRSLLPLKDDVVVANLFHVGAVKAVFARAAAAGAVSVLDAELPEIERWGWEQALEAASLADIVFTNRQALTAWMARMDIGGPLQAAAVRFARALAGERGRACVTLGAEGLVACDRSRIVRLPSLSVTVRNTTGAGDVFLAAFLRASRLGSDFESALVKASVAAGLFVEVGLHDWADVEARTRLHKQDIDKDRP